MTSVLTDQPTEEWSHLVWSRDSYDRRVSWVIPTSPDKISYQVALIVFECEQALVLVLCFVYMYFLCVLGRKKLTKSLLIQKEARYLKMTETEKYNIYPF